MMGSFSRPLAPLVCCGGALGIAMAGSWAFAGGTTTSIVEMPPVVATVLPPLPPPDSLAKLLVSPETDFRSTRATTSMLLEAVRVVEWIPSSNERADLLTEIAEFPELDPEVVSAVSRSAAFIGSPSARSRVLRALIRNHPDASVESRRPVLDAISSMQSTPERAMTLELFVTMPRLSEGALLDAFAHVDRLRADNERARVLTAAAGAQRIDGRARAAYVRLAMSMQSSRYRDRTLDALQGQRRRHIPEG
jgi:hypothetical protein